MNIINQSDILKALQKNSRFDSLLHQCNTFLGTGEGVSEVLDHFNKECEGMQNEAILEYLFQRYEKEHSDFFANFKHLSKISSLFLSTIKGENEKLKIE